jgi:hypothetical protein
MRKMIFGLLAAASLFVSAALAQKGVPVPPPPACPYGTVTVTSCQPDAQVCAAWNLKYSGYPCPYQTCTNSSVCAPAPIEPPAPVYPNK